MGLDILVWRGCKEQKRLGRARFVNAIKLRTNIERMRSALAVHGVADAEQDARKVKFPVLDEDGGHDVREAEVGALVVEDEKWRNRLKECANCSLGGKVKGGCFVSVPYVEDDHLCRELFSFFTGLVTDTKTSAYMLFDRVLARIELDEVEQFAAGFTSESEREAISVEEIEVSNRALLGAILGYTQDPDARTSIVPFLKDFFVHVTIGRSIDELTGLPSEVLAAALTSASAGAPVAISSDGALELRARKDTWELLTGPISSRLLQLAVVLDRVEADDEVFWDG